MGRFSMTAVIDNPKATIAKNNLLFYQQQLQQLQSQAQSQNNKGARFGKMDLSSAMIQRVARAPTGCGGCGK